MGNYNFHKDLKIAKKTEQEVSEILEANGLKILSFGNNSDYDILAEWDGHDNPVSFEVKEDFMCELTGNVSLEFESRGKPSGIESTKADWWIYKIHTRHSGIQFFLFPTEFLIFPFP